VTLRCLLVDDNGDFLAAARRQLERDGIDVVGVATTGTDAMVQVSELHPDVALVDVHLGAENGLDVARRLLETSESMSVILISTYDESDLADTVISGRAGWLWQGKLSGSAIRSVVRRAPPATHNP
jgi:two-component system, NarL family, nitrate/nitrite response regulator NarL